MDSVDAHIPKKAKKGWTEKHFSLCKKHGGTYTIHYTKECRHYNKDGSHKKAGGMPTPSKPACGKGGMNFAQWIHMETRKAVHSALKKSYCGGSIGAATKRVIEILAPTIEVFGQIAQEI